MPVCIYHTRDCLPACSKRNQFKWQFAVRSLFNTLSWFPLKLSNSPSLLAEGLLRKPLAYFRPRMDCQCSLCSLFVQPTVTPLANFAHMPRADSGAASGCGEPCLANRSAVSIPTNPGTLTNCILFCFASLVRNWWHSQASLEFICKLATTDNTHVPARTALFSTTHALMEHISAWNA